MENYKFALVIGRFQPPSNHHLEMLKEVYEISKCNKLLVGIGDSGKIDNRNFLKVTEVEELMKIILKKLNINYEIKIVRDLNNPPKYGEWVEKIFPEINENNCVLFTENDYTKDCFVNYSHNYKVICPTIRPEKATMVREMILKNNSEWRRLVPEKVVEYINKNRLDKRLSK